MSAPTRLHSEDYKKSLMNTLQNKNEFYVKNEYCVV